MDSRNDFTKSPRRNQQRQLAGHAAAFDLNQGTGGRGPLKIKTQASVGAKYRAGADDDSNRAIPETVQGVRKLRGSAETVTVQLRRLRPERTVRYAAARQLHGEIAADRP